jgi:RimJ/RimL family protein N-acetyltransferase
MIFKGRRTAFPFSLEPFSVLTITLQDLILRPIEHADAERFAELCNDETLARNTSTIPFPYTIEDAKNFVNQSIHDVDTSAQYRFAVCRAGEIIACTGLMRTEDTAFELGYWVGQKARGQGIATKAASAIIRYAFEKLGGETINAGYFLDNPASGRVLEKLGFKPTGEIVKTHSLARNSEVETARFLLTRPAFTPI